MITSRLSQMQLIWSFMVVNVIHEFSVKGLFLLLLYVMDCCCVILIVLFRENSSFAFRGLILMIAWISM
jgi:hypothetical protein